MTPLIAAVVAYTMLILLQISVDCGGGTVDIISYKATRTEPMEVTEVVKGEGQYYRVFLIFFAGVRRGNIVLTNSYRWAAWRDFRRRTSPVLVPRQGTSDHSQRFEQRQ